MTSDNVTASGTKLPAELLDGVPEPAVSDDDEPRFVGNLAAWLDAAEAAGALPGYRTHDYSTALSPAAWVGRYDEDAIAGAVRYDDGAEFLIVAVDGRIMAVAAGFAVLDDDEERCDRCGGLVDDGDDPGRIDLDSNTIVDVCSDACGAAIVEQYRSDTASAS
jgi:hypothetical protein